MEEVPAQISPKMPIFPNIKGEISFEHVHFSYAGSSRESLNQIDFHIMPGETLGIIGPTGSGKTTWSIWFPVSMMQPKEKCN